MAMLKGKSTALLLLIIQLANLEYYDLKANGVA